MESSRVMEDAVAKETAVVEDEAAVGKAPGMKFEAIAHSSLSQNLTSSDKEETSGGEWQAFSEQGSEIFCEDGDGDGDPGTSRWLRWIVHVPHIYPWPCRGGSFTSEQQLSLSPTDSI